MEKKKFEVELTEDQICKLIDIIYNESDLCDCFYDDNGTIITYDDNGNKILISFSEYLDSRLENILNQ